MSEYQVGPGWWQASDGRWYPLHLHPQAAERSDAHVSPEGWWQASDGRWYPPGLHLDAVRADEPAEGPGGPAASSPPAEAPAEDSATGPAAGPFPSSRETSGWEELWRPPPPDESGDAVGASSSSARTMRRLRRGRRGFRKDAAAAVLIFLVVGALAAVFVIPLTSRPSTAAPTTTRGAASTRASTSEATVAASMLSARLADRIVASEWHVFVRAATTRSLHSLESVASGYVAKVVESSWVCRCSSWSPSYASVEVTAPPERAYPLSFLAELDQPADPAGASVQIVVFEQHSLHAPWLIMSVSGYGGRSHELVQPSDLSATPDSLAPGELPFAELAETFASLRQTGKAPAGDRWQDTPGGGSAVQPSRLEATYEDSYRNDVRAGFIVSASFSAVGYSPTFSTGKADLQCVTILGRVIVRPRAGRVIADPPNSVLGLAPGTYSSVTQLEALGVCMARPPSAQVDVVGLVGGSFLVVGKHRT